MTPTSSSQWRKPLQEVLRSARARIDGKPLFFVEPDPHDPLKLFYRWRCRIRSPDAQFTYRNMRHVSPIISPPSSSAPAGTTRTAIFRQF